MLGPARLQTHTHASGTESSTAAAASVAADSAGLDAAFDAQLGELLGSKTTGAAALAGIDAASDASYDFDEYVMLRNSDDPYVDPRRPTERDRPVPSDPRMAAFAAEVQLWIANFVDDAHGAALATGVQVELAYVARLTSDVTSWWHAVAATRAFNQLALYAPTSIAAQKFNDTTGLAPNTYYAYCVYSLLRQHSYQEATAYLTTKNIAAVDDMLRADYWERLHIDLFDTFFSKPAILLGGHSADYGFDPYPPGEILVGVQLIHRQSWRLLNYGRGELVKTIPLGPRESQKVSVKVTNRTKTTSESEESSSYETTTESSDTAKNTSEVVDEASKTVNKHAEAEISGGFGPFVQAKISGGIAEDLASSSRDTKSRLNEVMSKTAGRMKRDTKVTISTESESTYETSRSSELTNPNDELAVTYLYHRLQQRFWVSTRLAELHSVVFIPELLPQPEDINEAWVAQHADILGPALLDRAFAGILSAIRKEPTTMPVSTDDRFTRSADSAIGATDNFRTYSGQGTIPNFLASGQQYLERDVERRTAAASDAARRTHQTGALVAHIRRNILHYMRAIWRAEDFDQRMQRYSRRRVPTQWSFVPRTFPAPGSAPTPLEVDGMFVPVAGSEKPLNQVIDPIGPIGYIFNCAIYRLRDDVRLANMHQALAWLRAAYTGFSVTTSISSDANITLRHAVAVSPRTYQYEVKIVYRQASGRWLVPIPGRAEKDWLELNKPVHGMLEVAGVRLWLDGTPQDQAELTITVASTGELEDPHIRMIRAERPLPRDDSAATTFTAETLRSMANLLPEVGDSLDGATDWATLTAEQKKTVMDSYHAWIMLRTSGRLVTLETGNVILDLATSTTPLLEPYKRLHRYIDVARERENTRRLELDNQRRKALLDQGRLGDPDIERVSLFSAPPEYAHLVETGDHDGPDDNHTPEVNPP